MLFFILGVATFFISYIVARFLGFDRGDAFVLSLCIANDVIDLGVGMLPIVGDMFDIVVIFLAVARTRTFWQLLSILEIVPGLDIFPIHTVVTYLCMKKKGKSEEKKRIFSSYLR